MQEVTFDANGEPVQITVTGLGNMDFTFNATVKSCELVREAIGLKAHEVHDVGSMHKFTPGPSRAVLSFKIKEVHVKP